MANSSGHAMRPDMNASVACTRQWAEAAFGGPAAGLPFSFVYGGRPSRALLDGWQRETRQEPGDGRTRHTLLLTDPETGLEVAAAWTVYDQTPGVDWTLHFTNRGRSDTPLLEQVQALDATLPMAQAHVSGDPAVPPMGGAHPILHRLHGSECTPQDWVPFDELLRPGVRRDFATRTGKSSRGACPFFSVDWEGGGVITGLGWSGQWQAAVEHARTGGVRQTAGMEHLHTVLHPGETIRSPRVLQVYWEGHGVEAGYQYFRQTMLRYITPRLGGQPVPPPIVHLSDAFYEMNQGTEQNLFSHLESLDGLGFEYFWVDAYWHKDGFPFGMGNYGFPLQMAEAADRYPRGLKPVAAAAHAAGMGFVLWFEPERVHPGTYIACEHPDWVITTETQGSGLYNLGHPAGRAHLTRYLTACIREYGIDCLRIDYNIDPLPFWQKVNAEDPARVGMAEIRYVEGLYRMWDEILAEFPHLFIDNCASGGMRIDLETCARSVPLWRTDATIFPLWDFDFDQAALQNQAMTAGLSRYLPFHTSGMMGATPYWFRSGFNGGTSFCEDLRPSGYPRDLLALAIGEGKRLRKYYFGNFYPLVESTASPEDWCILQYHRPAEGDGMVMAFRRHRSPYPAALCELREIEPDGAYEVTLARSYAPEPAVRMTGAALARLTLEIPEQPGSLVLEYRKV